MTAPRFISMKSKVSKPCVIFEEVGYQQGISYQDRLNSFDLTEMRSKRQGRQDVFVFKVFVIGQNLLRSHSRTEQFKNHLHWITQPANRGLAVTDVWINRDSFSQLHSLPLAEIVSHSVERVGTNSCLHSVTCLHCTPRHHASICRLTVRVLYVRRYS